MAAEISPDPPSQKVVILTALRMEFEAVAEQLEGRLESSVLRGGTIYEIGHFKGEKIDWTVAVAEIGAGNEGTGVEAALAIEQLRPDLLMFVGVAGSLKPDDAPRGSVVVADRVYGYQYGKDAELFNARPLTLSLSHRLSQLVKHVRRGDWDAGQEIRVQIGPIAAGNVVVASTTSGSYVAIRQFYNDAVAVEMESLGLYIAADRAGQLPVVSVRGISDCVDDKTASEDEHWQPAAAANASLFAFALLTAMRPEDIGATQDGARDSDAPEESLLWDCLSTPVQN